MGNEIERKYLVDRSLWSPRDAGTHLVQGYLSSHPERNVSVRIAGNAAKLTIKGITTGVTRVELEYDIPVADARVMLDSMCERPLIDKHRYTEDIGGRTWEIDIFHGDNDGLVIAEVELESEADVVEVPPWAGPEVSDDPRYYNANLLKAPYSSWSR
jgi:CYTH domain-containing protein